jgi:hypothetical protein
MRFRRIRALGRLLISVGGILVCCAVAAEERHQARERTATTLETPRAFGIDSYNVTTISAVSFYPDQRYYQYGTTADLSRYGEVQTVENFFATLELSEGVTIDYVGLNGVSPAPFALGIEVDQRRYDGYKNPIVSFDSTQHGMDTEFNATPIGFDYNAGSGDSLVIKVQQGAFDIPPVFGWVEVWWKRRVSYPGGPSFNDVPADHPFFQFIEALAASGITGGCGNGNYCPDATRTRGQMAVFLSKALGLHWPGN